MDVFGEDNPVYVFFKGVYDEVSNMGMEAASYIALAITVWIFLKLLHTCFSLPRRLNKHNDIQQMLEEKVNDYEKYLKEQEEKERAAGLDVTGNAEANISGLNGTPPDNRQSYEEKWKERREFLETLKKELRRVRDGGDPYDWGNLLDDDDEDNKVNDPNATSAEVEDCEETEEENVTEEMEENVTEEAEENVTKKAKENVIEEPKHGEDANAVKDSVDKKKD